MILKGVGKAYIRTHHWQ